LLLRATLPTETVALPSTVAVCASSNVGFAQRHYGRCRFLILLQG
jgi:hypothetical protein